MMLATPSKYRELNKNNVVVPARYNNRYTYLDLPVCPKCRDLVGCPVRMLDSYKNELVCKVFLDNPLVYYMAFATVIWGILLYLLWRRRENYLYWLWETYEEDAESLTRAEYRQLPKPQPVKVIKAKAKKRTKERLLTTKVRKDNFAGRGETWYYWRNFLNIVVCLAGIFLVGIVYPSFMILLSNKIQNKMGLIEEAGRIVYATEAKSKWGSYFVAGIDPKDGFQALERFSHVLCVIIGSLNGIFIIGLEIGWYMVHKMVMRKNVARSEWEYERTFTANMFGVSMLLNVAVIAFYALFKGAFYTYPDDPDAIQFLSIGYMNCGLLYCLDEIFLVFVATQKTKLFVEQIMCFLTDLPNDEQQHPKNFVPPSPDRAPCWERELRLLPIDDEFIMLQYNRLFIQIAVLCLFISVFPLAAIIAFFYNLWNMKYLAKLLVVHGRRPLLTQTWALSNWRNILFYIPYAACLTNAIYVVRNNSLLDRKVNKKYWSHRPKRRFFADYFLSFFNNSDYNMSGPEGNYIKNFRENSLRYFWEYRFCLFPGHYIRVRHLGTHYKHYTATAPKWYLEWRKWLFVLSFSVFVLGIAFFLNIYIGPVSGKVRRTRRAEEAVKMYGMENIKTKEE